jgi:hypothetical protein
MLNNMYKTLTGIIGKRISTHLEEQSLLPTEQKGCHPGSKVCKDQLIISKATYEDCRSRNKNLSIAWIDYQRVFECSTQLGEKVNRIGRNKMQNY